MNQSAIFWPMIMHFVLVAAVYSLLSLRRRAAVKGGETRASAFRENVSEPPSSLFVRNNLNNQFELPPFFHIVCLALFVTGGVGVFTLALAWVFVLSRYVHTAIHVTSNRLRYRQPIFAFGFAVVVLMWVLFAFHLATA
jgi:hypothetical protein